MSEHLANQIAALVDVTISDDFSEGYNSAVKAAAALARADAGAVTVKQLKSAWQRLEDQIDDANEFTAAAWLEMRNAVAALDASPALDPLGAEWMRGRAIEEAKAMADFSCGHMSPSCTCYREKEAYLLCAEHLSEVLTSPTNADLDAAAMARLPWVRELVEAAKHQLDRLDAYMAHGGAMLAEQSLQADTELRAALARAKEASHE